MISQQLTDYQNIPVFNSHDPVALNQLFELVIKKVFPLLPYVPDDHCQLCGLTCNLMVEKIIQGEKQYQDCVLYQTSLQLLIGSKEIAIDSDSQRKLRQLFITDIIK